MKRFKNLASFVLTVAFIFVVFSLQALAQEDVTSGSSVVVTSRPASSTPRKPARKAMQSRRSAANSPSKTAGATGKKTINISPSKSNETNSKDSTSGENTFLNEEAAFLPLPVWTREAILANADGLVEVVVTVDEKGDVTAAKARAGNKLLYESAENAALQAKFNSTKINKLAVRTGYLVFCFGNHPDCN